VITNATLGRAARDVVLHPVAFKDLGLAAVHSHRNRHDQLSFGVSQNIAHRLFQFEIIGGAIELLLGNLKRIQFFPGGCC
jgi:hypothetical protein